jgi:hypothetical protein
MDMTWITVAITLMIAAGALYYVVAPLLKPGPARPLVDDDRLTELVARKDATLVAIKDLEFDYRVGKLDQADYERFDRQLRHQAIVLMQQIEQLAPASTALDVTLEEEIARRRKVTKLVPVAATAAPASSTAQLEASLEAEIAAKRKTAPAGVEVGAATSAGGTPTPANGGAVRFCTNCGATLAPNHKFCAQCGTPVAAVEPAAAPQPAG